MQFDSIALLFPDWQITKFILLWVEIMKLRLKLLAKSEEEFVIRIINIY